MEQVMLIVEMKAQIFEIVRFLERMKYRVTDDPTSIAPQLAAANLAESYVLAAVARASVLSGDPDGSPARALINFKREMRQYHLEAAKRLAAELAELRGRGGDGS